jgi:PAS domain S-box-containing protein
MIYQLTMKPDGTYFLPFVSETIRDYYGCSPEDVREKLSPIIKVILPEDLDNFLSSIEYSAKNMADWTCEYRVQLPGKPIRWMSGNSTPEKLADGSVTWHGLNTDITERKRAEERLFKSEEKFFKIFMTTPDCIAITRLKDGLVMDVNKGFEDMVGWKAKEAIGTIVTKPPHIFWVNLSARDFMVKELKSGRDVMYREFEFRKRDGSIRAGIYSARSINIDGEECLIFILQDITESKKAEEQLRKSEGIFRVLFNQSSRLIGLLRPDGVLLQINKTAKTFSGISEKDALGKPFWATPCWSHSRFEQERLKKAIKRAAKGEFIRYKSTHYNSDETLCHVDFSISPVKDDDGKVILLIPEGSDITESKQAEEGLRNSHRRLDEIIDFLPDATFVIDCEGKIITWNKSTEMITGVSKTDMIGRGKYEYAIPLYGERRPILIDLVLQPDDVFEKSHYENVTRQGDTLYAESYLPMAYGGKGAFMWGTASKLRDTSGKTIGAIESVRDITERRRTEDELKQFAESLEDANIALRVLMNRRDKDQKEFEEKLQVNINDLVIPYLKKLSRGNLDDRNKSYVDALEHNLGDVLSPFMRDFQSAHKNLTPKEIQIIDLIKQGKDTKEIADMLNASISTITTHRNNIRKKLNLINSKINLRSHILSFK